MDIKRLPYLLVIISLFSYCPFALTDTANAPTSKDRMDAGDKKSPDADLAKAMEESKKHTEEGVKLLKDKKIDEAISSFNKAIKLDPDNKEARKNLGITYSWDQRHDDAIGVFKELISAYPDYVDAYRHLVLIYNMLGMYKEAVEYGEKSLKIYPDDFGVIGYLAGNYINVGEFEKAVEFSKKLIEKDPEQYRSYRFLAMAYIALGKNKEARSAFKKNYDMLKKRNALFSIHGDKQDMNSLFKKLKAEVFFLEGNRYIENKDQIKSIESYKKSLEFDSSDYKPYYNLAMIYKRMREDELALENLKKAVELNPILLNQVMNSSDFDSLKGLKGFKEIERLQQKKAD